MQNYDQMMSQTKLPEEGERGDYFDPPVGRHIVEIVSVEEKVLEKDGQVPTDYIVFNLRMLAPEFSAAVFTRPFFLWRDSIQDQLKYLGQALQACGIWSEGQPLSAATMRFPSLQGKRLEINVVKRKSDATKVNVYFNKLVTPAGGQLPVRAQQPYRQAPAQQQYAQTSQDFGTGNEEVPFDVPPQDQGTGF